MNRVLVASIVALTLVAAPAAPVALAQEEEAERIEALMGQAIDHMTAGAGLIERARKLQGEEAERARAQGVAAYDEALAKYGQILELLAGLPFPEDAKDGVRQLVYYNTACARSMQGRADEALTALGQALEAGFDDFDHIAKDTDLDPIRREPRFAQLIERARGGAAGPDAGLFPYDFTVTTLDGKRLALADLRGKVVIVDFWGTWCPPCRAEIPHFVQLKKELGDRLEIVGMTWEHGQGGAEVEAKVRKFAEEQGVNYPLTLVTDRAELQKVPDLRAFPTTLFIDKQGRVRNKVVGYHDLDALRRMIEPLLAEQGPAPAPAQGGQGGVGPF
ncbi:MAG: redoxin domain-containing protein [Planctomycetes bacterium]|nr:redoxin domain-containing protein [Planctomycetota bacterium]